ncbi:MAG: ASCH domain-containing protein [Deferrisomatales bacterium]|nr:ASCH domain-containing protein [Deferrisomatales bacterium]
MADAETGRVALFSINPEYAKQIMDGSKRVEFRKNGFDSNLGYVIVYATTPVKKVLGFFEVSGVERASPLDLWRRHKQHGGIKYGDFRKYYAGKKTAVAIGVGRLCLLGKPIDLAALGDGLIPPQSFCYVGEEVLRKIEALCS